MPHTFVIFGASGDLTQRKLIPALYQLYRKGRLPSDTRIVGVSRSKFTHDGWRALLADTTAKQIGGDFDQGLWHTLSQSIYYLPGDIGHAADFLKLAQFLQEIEKSQTSTRIYYLATSPSFYETAIEQLGRAGLGDEGGGPRRIIVEKPFGTDLESARHLNAAIHSVFQERQVFRIDHYLGKETVQNILVLRFANAIFEPIWNRNYIDHVQLTVAEEVDVGRRAEYYDSAGVIRDMFQNHLLQLMTITAMEPPVRFEADAIRSEKLKVLQAVRPLQGEDVHRATLRGQYRGYAALPGVKSKSRTATFAVVKLQVDNWRWQGVPFYLRSGKAMSCRTTQIVVEFHQPPHILFPGAVKRDGGSNRLVIQVQPAEGIQLEFQTKVPDAGMKLRQTDLEFRFAREFRGMMPEAYERLLLDALEGDASLFARADEVEAAWTICDRILDEWSSSNQPPLYIYEPGIWGPTASTEWMAAHGRQWFDICPVLH
jgi:glucose-6-phosphate 1-dehydrogenase